jgi:hypothetical protein
VGHHGFNGAETAGKPEIALLEAFDGLCRGSVLRGWKGGVIHPLMMPFSDYFITFIRFSKYFGKIKS